jgi:hypothetical protein
MNAMIESKERAICREKTKEEERARKSEKTKGKERANSREKTIKLERPTFTDILTVRILVRTREDFQSMRQKVDNRMGRKANGEQQNVEERTFRLEDLEMFKKIADDAKEKEVECEKNLKRVLKRFPIWTEYLEGVKGVGTIASGWIIGEFDIEKATTVSKMWQFAGLNPGMVRGVKDIEKDKYKPSMGEVIREYTTMKGVKHVHVLTDELIKGDKLTEGFTAPFNQNLRTALVGVLADGFIKQQNYYCMEFYYPYKARLEQEENTVIHVGKEKQWKEVNKGHRDRAAKRYMIKMFLKDLYVAWRTIEGLPVRPSYQEEYLGHKH